MSYSFSVQGDTKAAARAAAEAHFANVIANQPVHERDREAALDNLDNHLALIADPSPDELVKVSMNGSLGWEGSVGLSISRITHASSSASVHVERKPADPAA